MKQLDDDIILRKWCIDDSKPLANIANNKKISDNLRDGFPHPYRLSDADDWIKMVLQKETPSFFFAIDYNNELAGSIGAVIKEDIYRKTAEIGYFLGESFWGKGIATRSIKLMVDILFKQTDVVRIYAEPFFHNKASRSALDKAGFEHEATLKKNIFKNGVIMDSCIYACFRPE